MPDREKMESEDDQKCPIRNEAGSSVEYSSPVSDDVNEDNLKRVQTFMMDGWAAASPPKFVSFEEIMKAAKGMQNMALAHEIAVDKNFKIEKLETDDNTLHRKVKEIMHKAFWDLLTSQLSEEPPNYTQALVLLKEIKESLDELLLPRNIKIRESIEEVLDIDLIKQQAEKGVLDFHHYSQYVISIMGKICAPVRDEKIEELKKCTQVIDTFRGIMEMLQLMKLDLANFTISMIRPNIVASSIEYEKTKFAEFLKIQADGLQYTRKWLLKNANVEKMSMASTDQNSVKIITHSLLADAFLDLLEFDSTPNAETLMLDQGRLIDLRNKTCRLSIVGSVLMLIKPLENFSDCKQDVKNHVTVLLNSVTSNKDVEATMPNIFVQVKADLEKALRIPGNTEFQNLLSILEGQILGLAKPDHKVRELVRSRIRQFLQKIILSQSTVPQQVPAGLSLLQEELASIAAQFLILVAHNRSVFGEYYQDIVSAASQEKKFSGVQNSEVKMET